MKRIAILIFCFVLAGVQFLFAADVSPEAISRSEELLKQQEALREKIEKEKAVFIEKVILLGLNVLPQEEAEKIVAPFQKRWLNKEDIGLVINLLRQAYEERLRLEEKGYKNLLSSYEINKETLFITFEEPSR